MKNLKYLLITIIMFVISISNCYAFDKNYKYNYEVTSVDFDGQRGTLAGWAILNAGVTDGTNSSSHGSPTLNRNLESTSSNPYEYSLRVYAINIDGNNYKEVRYITATKQSTSNPLSLYQIMCQRTYGSSCHAPHSANYEKVDYKFVFNFNDFNDSSKYVNAAYPNAKIDGYKFVLTVKSTAGDCNGSTDSSCQQTFPLSFIKSAVSEDAQKYFDSNTYMDKIYFIANTAYLRSENCSGGYRVTQIDSAGSTYQLVDSDYCTSKNITYYKIKVGSSTGWVPASWIAPLKDTYTIVRNDVCDVDGEKIRFSGVENEVESKSCEAFVSLRDSVTESCITKDQTEYYKITCEDIIETTFTPSRTKYYRGDDFQLDVKMTSYVSCTGEFYYDKWNSHYARGDSNTRHNLNEIKENFKNFTMNSYDVNPNGVMTYEISSNPIQNANVELVIESKQDFSEAQKNIEYTSASRSVPKSLTYTSNKQEIIMRLQAPIEVNAEKINTPYKIVINNAGFSATSKVNFDCEIEKIIAVYRTVDSKNPFISSDRIIGENWRNDKYNFVEVIDEEIWSNNQPEFMFSISTQNIADIKHNNGLLGTDAYLGTSCELVANKYKCDFIRDGNYFTNIFIHGEKIK